MDAAEFDWTMVVESELDNAVDAVVSADLAVHAVIQGFSSAQTEPVPRDARASRSGKNPDRTVYAGERRSGSSGIAQYDSPVVYV